MPRFSPARKLPSVIGLFAVATPFVALLAASFRAYKRSWPADALLDLFGVVFIAVAVSSLLVAEVMRQRKAEISGAGFLLRNGVSQGASHFFRTSRADIDGVMSRTSVEMAIP